MANNKTFPNNKNESVYLSLMKTLFVISISLFFVFCYIYTYTNTHLFYYTVERADGPHSIDIYNKTPEVVCGLSYQPEESISLFYLHKRGCYYINAPSEPLINQEKGFMPWVISHMKWFIWFFVIWFLGLHGKSIWRKIKNV